MEEENTVSQEELVQKEDLNDGVVKVDFRNVNKEENVSSENDEETGVRVQDSDVQLPASGDAPADQLESEEPSEVRSSDEEEPLQDDGEPASEVRVLEEIVDEEEEPEEDLVEDTQSQEQEVLEATEEKVDVNLPENIEKLVEFMNETGGSLEDYVRLNQDVDALDQEQLVKEYYKSTKPHLDDSEIDFLIEDSYSFDEELDEERDIKRKKLLYKEEVQRAKDHLNGMKSKYYEDIKAGSRLTPEQQNAVDFFNRYEEQTKESSQLAKKQASVFQSKTDNVFNPEFKGFEYEVGEKKYRFNVKDAGKVKENQSDISNFTRKFLGQDNTIGDAKGYHKALFTAMNADAVANHFYQQGKADAVKETSARSKNVKMDPRGQHEAATQVGGMKVRAISGDDSQRLRVKISK
jgi:hypothetical protein